MTLTTLLAPYRTSAIADALGVSEATVRGWRNSLSRPSVDRVETLARFLRVDTSTVLSAISNTTTVQGVDGVSEQGAA